MILTYKIDGYSKVTVEVPSYEEASKIVRRALDDTSLVDGLVGSSGFAGATLKNEAGKLLGHVSYNGRVWTGGPRSWKPGKVPLFDPFSNEGRKR